MSYPRQQKLFTLSSQKHKKQIKQGTVERVHYSSYTDDQLNRGLQALANYLYPLLNEEVMIFEENEENSGNEENWDYDIEDDFRVWILGWEDGASIQIPKTEGKDDGNISFSKAFLFFGPYGPNGHVRYFMNKGLETVPQRLSKKLQIKHVFAVHQNPETETEKGKVFVIARWAFRNKEGDVVEDKGPPIYRTNEEPTIDNIKQKTYSSILKGL